jgi:hypothetical protein
MEEGAAPSPHELKAGIRESELVEAAQRMIRGYLTGTVARSSAELLITEFERLTEEMYPNLERIGCPGIENLRQLAIGKALGRDMDHLNQCGPCLREYGHLLAQLNEKDSH